jgi:hypothetical protein
VRKKRLEVGGDDVAWQRGPLVSEGEGRTLTLSGGGGAGPWPLRWLGRNGSPEPFSIFFLLSPFLFLFSYFYFIFCKYASKPLKPLSKISLNSKYQSGTVRNRFLK